MKDYEEIILAMVVSGFFGIFLGKVYKFTHSRAVDSSSMERSFVIYSMLITMLLFLNFYIGGLAVIGSVTINRFRSPLKDHRDILYIVWLVASSFSIVSHQYYSLGLGSVFIIFLMYITGSLKNYNRVLLVVRGKSEMENNVIDRISQKFGNSLKMRYNNSAKGAEMELIYELNPKIENPFEKAMLMKKDLYESGEVQEVNCIYQEDDMAI
ncbi:hypothetical protein [Lachnobacterium bovis]|uniref:hypothetical protein n=1 Tax=Lachnobacterium bovis TaxID=140626 RepID=UPI0003B6249E|nr:hypothetical protein [Lachnobacterium bovis]